MDKKPVLNAVQHAIVHHDLSRSMLVLSGAGSGKTTCIVNRIVHLITERQVEASSILAVTFTNKAAKELRTRIEAATSKSDVMVSTFHGLCARLLRRFGTGFCIIDSQRASALLKTAMNMTPRASKGSVSIMNSWRNDGKNPEDLEDVTDDRKDALELYRTYRALCRNVNGVDFHDILLNAVRLLRRNGDALREVRREWQHVMVDEFQDTNVVQFDLIQLLVPPLAQSPEEKRRTLMVVGDDYQAIHEWRGATVRNILEFQEYYDGTHVYIMEHNYRSKEPIISAANTVIANNAKRSDKTLLCTRGPGAPVRIVCARDEEHEARIVADEIAGLVRANKGQHRDFAVLYRVNAQSRPLEMSLKNCGVPYVLRNAYNFFERAEIKDAIAYLRLAFDRPCDDGTVLRIINTPPRGFGKATIAKLTESKGDDETVLSRVLGDRKLDRFTQCFRGVVSGPEDRNLSRACRECLRRAGYVAWLERQGGSAQEHVDRIENLDALYRYLETLDGRSDAWDTFEDDIATGEFASGGGNAADAVALMTMHASKGLEFGHVYMVGMSEGLMPHKWSFNDIESERRLCYVGITRAMETLTLLTRSVEPPSRFISEMNVA